MCKANDWMLQDPFTFCTQIIPLPAIFAFMVSLIELQNHRVILSKWR